MNPPAKRAPLDAPARAVPTEVVGGRRAPLWLWPNLLSLDAPLVAITWQAAFAAALGATLAPVHVGVLFGSVWLVYAGDRWLDTWRATAPRTPRHDFAARHRRLLFLALALVFPLTAWWACRGLGPGCIRSGLALTVPVIAYLALAHFFPRVGALKEGLIAVLFALGTAAFPLTLAAEAGDARRGALLALPLFAGLVWLNCRAIETWEQRGADAARLRRTAGKLLRVSALAFAVLVLWHGSLVDVPLYAGLLIGAAGLGTLLAPDGPSPNARRALADAVLLGPALFLLV